MIHITKIKEEFCQELHTIYAINIQNDTGGSLITSEICPNCKTRNIFKVFNAKDVLLNNIQYLTSNKKN